VPAFGNKSGDRARIVVPVGPGYDPDVEIPSPHRTVHMLDEATGLPCTPEPHADAAPAPDSEDTD